jgi:hypothetical protein
MQIKTKKVLHQKSQEECKKKICHINYCQAALPGMLLVTKVKVNI